MNCHKFNCEHDYFNNDCYDYEDENLKKEVQKELYRALYNKEGFDDRYENYFEKSINIDDLIENGHVPTDENDEIYLSDELVDYAFEKLKAFDELTKCKEILARMEKEAV
ncbi:MAG: hypothetical protein LBH46_00755 [Rickettsiales bacterium]|jgi:hypothetical protein|nr:hypothetical protein [Rickettsiales bacterium]